MGSYGMRSSPPNPAVKGTRRTQALLKVRGLFGFVVRFSPATGAPYFYVRHRKKKPSHYPTTENKMLAFRVQLNNHPPVIGGASDLSVLTTTITAVGQLGSQTYRKRSNEMVDINLRLGGLTSRRPEVQDEHLVWLETHELKPGDKVLVEVIETDTPDPVQCGEVAEKRADDERAYFEHCKRGYFEMREKYEGKA